MLPEVSFPFNIISGLAFILLIFILISYQSGWYELAKLYKTDLKHTESLTQKGKSCTCSMGKNLITGYKGLLIAFLDTGMYLNFAGVSLPVLDIINPSLLIPWKDISNYEITRDGKHKLYLGNPMITILSLSTKTVRELEDLSGIKISDYLNSN